MVVEAKDVKLIILMLIPQFQDSNGLVFHLFSRKVLVKKEQFVMKKFIKSLVNTEGNITINADEFDTKYDDYIFEQ